MYTVGKTLCDRNVQQGVDVPPPMQNVKLKVKCVKTLNFRQLS